MMAGLCTIVVVYLTRLSALPFDGFRRLVLSAIPPGYEHRFTPALYSKVILSLRIAAGLFFAIGLGFVVFARFLAELVVLALADIRSLVAHLREATTSILSDRWHLATFLLLFLWGAVARLAFLGEPIRNDEAYTFMHYASRPVLLGLSYYTTNNHILNTLLMHVSTASFGPSVWTVRLPTMVSGIVLVPLSYATARVFYGKNAALICMALVSGSSPLIEYSFNARGYCLATLFFVALLLLTGLIQKGYAGAWIFVPLCAALSLYAIPVMIYAVGGIFLYFLITRTALRPTLLAMVATGGLTAVLYAPVIGTVGISAITSNQWVAPVARSQLLSLSTREIVSLWNYWSLDNPAWLWLTTVAMIVVALFTAEVQRSAPVKILVCVTAVILITVGVSCVIPPRRTLLFVMPLFFAVAAAGSNVILRTIRGGEKVAVVGALTLAAVMGSTVLQVRSLRHSGIESFGARSAEAVVLGVADRLPRGGQFVCPADYYDAPMDFYLFIHHIPYSPSPTGELLIVTPGRQPPAEALALASIPAGNVTCIEKIGTFQDAVVYSGKRGPNLPFIPVGTTEMGMFTTVRGH